MTAGTPSLNRPLPDRSEAEARIERALKVARIALEMADAIHDGFPADKLTFALGGLEEVISILDGKSTKED